ncbi:MAG: hypothetical protein QNJ91_13000 [Gammaproteobacteria bacterium]|nr:hypothetical protein [Gammaproteobacteria bacterium]
MKTRKSTYVLLMAASMLASAAVHAGGWAKGYGETVKEATESSLLAAREVVNSRGKGCVGRSDGGPTTRLAPREQGLFVVETFYSHHNGSCGKMSADEAWVRDQVGRLLGGL